MLVFLPTDGEAFWQLPPNSISCTIKCSIFHMKITASVQKARIKIVTRAIYTYLFFSYTYTLLFYWKIKSGCDCCFPQQIKQITSIIYNMSLFH